MSFPWSQIGDGEKDEHAYLARHWARCHVLHLSRDPIVHGRADASVGVCLGAGPSSFHSFCHRGHGAVHVNLHNFPILPHGKKRGWVSFPAFLSSSCLPPPPQEGAHMNNFLVSLIPSTHDIHERTS